MKLIANEDLEVKALALGSYETNVYVVLCSKTREGVIIDAAAEPDKILAAIGDAKIRYILLTHGHADHTGALAELRRMLGAPVGIHAEDKAMLETPPDFEITDGATLPFGASTLTAIHTPGHTPGSVCLYHPPLLFSGDTLFPGGPGATAHPLGSFPVIIESVRQRLFVLPDETRVLPGHGLDTTVGKERPFLDEWIARGW